MATTCPPGFHEENGHCCASCPKGKYISVHCSDSSTTKCATCPHETFTEHDNYLNKCLPCISCSQETHYEVRPCKEHSNRQCGCKDGFYCTDLSSDHCEHCRSVKSCPPGKGVSAKPTKVSDTICISCSKETFNNVEDYKTPCLNHTNCEVLGRRLLIPGNSTNDAVCGDVIPKPDENIQNCHWMLPAGLWAGLIMTILIFFVIVLLYWRAKRKPQQTGSVPVYSQCPEGYSFPELPPDVIKHPKSPEIETLFHKDEIIHNTKLHDCTLECDGAAMTMTASEKYEYPPSLDQCVMFPDVPSILQSEPQEDEWPGA